MCTVQEHLTYFHLLLNKLFMFWCFVRKWETFVLQCLLMCTFIFRRHVLDALPMLGSNAAIAVMKDIILKNGVPQGVVHEWLFALSFIPRYLLQWTNWMEYFLAYSLWHSDLIHMLCFLLHINFWGRGSLHNSLLMV